MQAPCMLADARPFRRRASPRLVVRLTLAERVVGRAPGVELEGARPSWQEQLLGAYPIANVTVSVAATSCVPGSIATSSAAASMPA
jgi:hypothetical protein